MDYVVSRQYIRKKQITVTILNIIDPVHYVLKESPILNASSEAKNFIEAEEAMQKYYASVEPSFFQLPLKDAIVVVLYKEKFYRARVMRILTLSAGHLFKVYLVDYGTECSISRDSIYEIEKDFLLHPFQAVSFKLLGMEPISLIMNCADLSMSYGPVADWDHSAAAYVQDLKKSMCSAYIEVQGFDDHHTYGRLYLCFEHIPTICINDELISNSYARFKEDCWKNVQKLENILDHSTEITNSSEAFQPVILEKVDLKLIPSSDNLSKQKLDLENFKMMLINPIDGKIVAESSVLEPPLIIEDDLQVQLLNPTDGKIVAESSFAESGVLEPSLIIEDDLKLQAVLENVKSLHKLQKKVQLKKMKEASLEVPQKILNEINPIEESTVNKSSIVSTQQNISPSMSSNKAILENVKTLQKLQNKVRLKKIKEEASLQMPQKILNGVTPIEEATVNKSSVNSIQQNISASVSSNEAILENVKTLQKLQNKVRLKKMKEASEALQMSQKILNGVTPIEEAIVNKSSVNSIQQNIL